MRWYYKIEGTHTHVRVFLNGAFCGTLTFTNEEFDRISNSVREIFMAGSGEMSTNVGMSSPFITLRDQVEFLKEANEIFEFHKKEGQQ